MITLLGSIIGFGTSFLPKVMDFFQDKQDKKHELAMMEKMHASRVEEAQITGEYAELVAAHKEQASTVRKASRFIANLSASIRPVVTYLFVTEFLIINWAIAWLMLDQQGVSLETLKSILDEEFMGLLSAMITFWFGSRELRRREGKV